MSCRSTLRKTGGSIILTIPKAIAESLDIKAGSEVDLTVDGGKLSVTPKRRGLTERLAASAKSPDHWTRDRGWLDDEPAGRELL
jgi:antitoxin ChpS